MSLKARFLTSLQVHTCTMWFHVEKEWIKWSSIYYVIIFYAAGMGRNTHAGHKVFPGSWQLWWTWWMMPKRRADVYSKHGPKSFSGGPFKGGIILIFSAAAFRRAEIRFCGGNQQRRLSQSDLWALKKKKKKTDRKSWKMYSILCPLYRCVCELALLWCTKSFAQQGLIVWKAWP